MRISIIDVGIGNVSSLKGWANQISEEVYLLNDPNMYDGGSIIIPGACASNELMRRLRNTGFNIMLKELSTTNVTIMGICAGFQVLTQSTSENEHLECLGLLDGHTIPLEQEKSVTLWKYSEIKIPKKTKLNKVFPRNTYIRGKYYFNHRFGVIKGGVIVDAAVENNIVGLQFHPEKSGVFGEPFLRILKG